MQIIQYSDINSSHLLTTLFLRYVYIIYVFKLYTVLCSSSSLLLAKKKKKIKILHDLLDFVFSNFLFMYLLYHRPLLKSLVLLLSFSCSYLLFYVDKLQFIQTFLH